VTYLSDAFTRRSPADLDLLQGMDGTAAFSLFWIDIVRPLLETAGARRILQVGAYKGEHTALLLEYCNGFDGSIIVVEPFVTPELRKVIEGNRRCLLLEEKSHDAIPRIDTPIDVVVLNGDLNYYTVIGDLRALSDMAERIGEPFPTILTKSMSWPYARRDMYYDPDSIPPGSRHDYESMGMSPWSPGLGEHGINAPFFNARQEGGPANGVRTAVEDFIEESSEDLRLFTLPLNHGLGIIYRPGSAVTGFIDRMVSPPPALRLLLETVEIARLNDILLRLRPAPAPEDLPEEKTTMPRRIHRLLRQLLSGG
jgi:hypothetical protein